MHRMHIVLIFQFHQLIADRRYYLLQARSNKTSTHSHRRADNCYHVTSNPKTLISIWFLSHRVIASTLEIHLIPMDSTTIDLARKSVRQKAHGRLFKQTQIRRHYFVTKPCTARIMASSVVCGPNTAGVVPSMRCDTWSQSCTSVSVFGGSSGSDWRWSPV